MPALNLKTREFGKATITYKPGVIEVQHPNYTKPVQIVRNQRDQHLFEARFDNGGSPVGFDGVFTDPEKMIIDLVRLLDSRDPGPKKTAKDKWEKNHPPKAPVNDAGSS